MLTQEQIQRYEQDGYLVLKQLLSIEECEKLKSVVHRLIDEWEPETDYSWVLPNGAKNGRSSAKPLIDSANKISFFIETDAIDPNTGKLNRDKFLSVRRIGHALHKLEPEFKKVTFSDKIKAIVHDLNFIKPAVRQTLYIFKQPFIGEKVITHRDSTFVYNDPLNILGVWIALEDCTLENGCLSFVPGSHLKPSRQRYIRNPNENFKEGDEFITVGEKDEHYDDDTFVPVEVNAGDALLIHGNVVHKSEQNKSPVSRQVFTFHIFETHNSVYCKENWLQLTEPFPLLYDE